MTDERAEYLVERYADLILRIGKTWLGDMDDAKDVCQTVLIKLLENPREFPDPVQERADIFLTEGSILFRPQVRNIEPQARQIPAGHLPAVLRGL